MTTNNLGDKNSENFLKQIMIFDAIMDSNINTRKISYLISKLKEIDKLFANNSFIFMTFGISIIICKKNNLN